MRTTMRINAWFKLRRDRGIAVGTAEAGVVIFTVKGIGNSDSATGTIDQPLFTTGYAMLNTGSKTQVSCLACGRNSVMSIGRSWRTAEAGEGDKDLQSGRGGALFDGLLKAVTTRYATRKHRVRASYCYQPSRARSKLTTLLHPVAT